MAFKDNLKRIRAEKGFRTAKEFTERGLRRDAEAGKTTKVNYTTYHAYENTNRLPPEDLIVAIAKSLKVSIDDLFGYSVDTLERKSEIDNAIDFMKELGIDAKRDMFMKEVVVKINDKIIASIPDEEIINIVNTAKKDIIPKVVASRIMFSNIMNDIIRYEKAGKPIYKKMGSIERNHVGSTDSDAYSKRKAKVFSKEFKHLLSDLNKEGD